MRYRLSRCPELNFVTQNSEIRKITAGYESNFYFEFPAFGADTPAFVVGRRGSRHAKTRGKFEYFSRNSGIAVYKYKTTGCYQVFICWRLDCIALAAGRRRYKQDKRMHNSQKSAQR